MNRRMGKRKLTRLILAALMSAGGGLFGAEAQAAEVTLPNSFSIATKVSAGQLVIIGTPSPTGVYLGTGYDSLTLIAGTPNDFGGLRYYAGYGTGDVSGYTLTVNGGLNIGGVYGGYSTGAGNVGNNTVTISGGTMGEVEGGYSSTGNVDGNSVTVDGGTISTIRGGDANGGTATNNSVTVNAGTIGEAGGYFVGGRGGNGASSNHVTINGGTIGEISGGIAGGWAVDGSAENNDVTITGGTIGKDVEGISVAGGFSNSSTGTAAGNTVSISGDTTNIAGSVYGGRASNGNATGNTVTISGGTVGEDEMKEVVGGQAAFTGEASNNIVEISGGTLKGYIRGGSGDIANNNIVTISENANIVGGTARIYGAMGFSEANNNTVNIFVPIDVLHLAGGDGCPGTGNTLNLAAKGVKVGNEGLLGFQNLNFYLPTDMTTSDTMLTVNGTANVTDAKVGVMARGKLENLTKDSKVTLLNAATLEGGDTIEQTTEIVVPTSIATSDKYEFKVTSDDKNIYATITKDDSGSGGGDDPVNPPDPSGDPTEDAKKSPVETKAATVTLLNAGADMLASQGFAQAANAVAIEAAEQAQNGAVGAPVARSFTPFAAFGGSSLRAESGSHVDTKGFGINVGFAKEFSNSQGKLLFGPVVEYGGGKYDSYNNDVHGDGNSHYWGFGLMARQTNHDGFYYEGSVRFGRVTSDYKSNNLIAGAQGQTSYDTASNYWAAHLGLGKVFATGKQDTVDAYLKYFYSHQGGDTTDIKYDGRYLDTVSFDSIDSNRIRIGARYTHKINEMNSLYGGLAYQYEFGGEARAHYTQGVGAPSPSVKGSSGMLELGWQVKPNNGPVTLDLGVTGWAGKQRGGSVQLGATWTF